jgi:hypothetical protein
MLAVLLPKAAMAATRFTHNTTRIDASWATRVKLDASQRLLEVEPVRTFQFMTQSTVIYMQIMIQIRLLVGEVAEHLLPA